MLRSRVGSGFLHIYFNMSLKLKYRPGDPERSPFADPAPVHAEDTVVSCIHQIRNSAKQICTDAADIEDARFLAENIIDACRQMLASGYDAAATSESTRLLHAERPDPVEPASMGIANSARGRAAAEKLTVLTERELEIFTYLAEGGSAADISAKLSRSGKTINNHRTRILHKLGLKNATELVRLAVSAGLISL